jgi:hypothetical protein
VPDALGVSRSGYYYYGWRDRPSSRRSSRHRTLSLLTEKIREIHQRSRQTELRISESPRPELKALWESLLSQTRSFERLMRGGGDAGEEADLVHHGRDLFLHRERVGLAGVL